ncbi:MAG: hypothetical protein QM759_10465 [Terricaulis sp.]
MKRALATLVIALTIVAPAASAAPIGATPCASAESVARAGAALQPFLHARVQPVGMVLLDCRVQSSQRLSCTARQQTQSDADLGAAAVAYANELEVCPGTPRRVMFPLVFRAGNDATQSP